MATLAGYDGRFGLMWRRAGDDGPWETCLSDDLPALRVRAQHLVAEGDALYAELSSWNFELNDWVRLETFGARDPRAAV